MALSIKNEETHRLASYLAGITGTSITAAVTASLREKIERTEKSGRLAQLVRQINADLGEGFQQADLDEMLYTKKGCRGETHKPSLSDLDLYS